MGWFEFGVQRVGTAGDESSFSPYLKVDSSCLGGILGEAFWPRLRLMVVFFTYEFLLFAKHFHNGIWQIVLVGVFDTFLVSKRNASRCLTFTSTIW